MQVCTLGNNTKPFSDLFLTTEAKYIFLEKPEVCINGHACRGRKQFFSYKVTTIKGAVLRAGERLTKASSFLAPVCLSS